MRGFARYINLRNAMAALETTEGFTVIEVLERCALDISDEITGPLDSPGPGMLRNVTKGEEFSALVEYVHCSRVEATELIA